MCQKKTIKDLMNWGSITMMWMGTQKTAHVKRRKEKIKWKKW